MRKILIGTDGSSASRTAIHRFIDSACGDDVEVHVVTVIPRVADDTLEDAQASLDEAMLDFASVGKAISIHTRVGRPAEEILEVARELDVDQIVLGTHDTLGLDDMLPGGVTPSVLHDAECGVLIYPAPQRRA